MTPDEDPAIEPPATYWIDITAVMHDM